MHYKTRGTCSSAIDLEIENGVITACKFTGGCPGNAAGLAIAVTGKRLVHRRLPRQHRGAGCGRDWPERQRSDGQAARHSLQGRDLLP